MSPKKLRKKIILKLLKKVNLPKKVLKADLYTQKSKFPQKSAQKRTQKRIFPQKSTKKRIVTKKAAQKSYFKKICSKKDFKKLF